MLKVKIVYDDEIFNSEAILDVETEFLKVRVPETETIKTLISEIDLGEYLDEQSFIDRFGDKVKLENLSTGCKAGILVAQEPTKTISLLECGDNARDAILKYIKNGNVELPYNGINISYDEDVDIDVELEGGFRAYKISELARELARVYGG